MGFEQVQFLHRDGYNIIIQIMYGHLTRKRKGAVTSVAIGVWFRHMLYLKLKFALCIAVLLAVNLTMPESGIIPLPDSLSEALIIPDGKGRFIAALHFKKETFKDEPIVYGASLEVWEFDKSMRIRRLLFKEQVSSGRVVYIGAPIWVGENLLYTVLVGFKSFKGFLQKAIEARRKDFRKGYPLGYDRERFQLKLWRHGWQKSRVVRKGVLGMGRRLLIPIDEEKFLIVDPEDTWLKVVMREGITKRELERKVWWHRVFEICAVTQSGEVRSLRKVDIFGLQRKMRIVGVAVEKDVLLAYSYYAPKGEKFIFGPPSWVWVDLKNKKVTVAPFTGKEYLPSRVRLLPNGVTIAWQPDIGFRLRLRYYDTEGNLIHERRIKHSYLSLPPSHPEACLIIDVISVDEVVTGNIYPRD